MATKLLDIESLLSIPVAFNNNNYTILNTYNVDPKRSVKSITRVASRGIIKQDNKYLMVYTPSENSYEFPGGGSEKNETPLDTLKREFNEETGYIISKINTLRLMYTERKNDKYEQHKYFEMQNYFYDCEIDSIQSETSLDTWEKELEIAPVWATLETALAANMEYCIRNDIESELWVVRALIVMSKLNTGQI